MGRKLIDTILFVLVVVGCVFLTMIAANGNYFNATTIYNFVFLAIMTVLYMIALFGGLYRMADLTAYFRKASGQIDEMPKDGSVSLKEKVRALSFYRPLAKTLERFRSDIEHSQSGICDIEDYVNEDEVAEHAHKRMIDMLPDILTSLGILGTFMGLVWGLRAFEPSSYEAMTSSVTSLVDGIKVAFLTSIYGLILSLVFSYSLKSGYSSVISALHAFLDRFHARVVPSADMDVQNRLVDNQREQNELIKSLTAQFSDQVASGFAASIAPTLDRINTQLGGMMSTISRNQQMFLQDIVDSFVREMKNSFQTEFSQFGKTLENMNESVNRNILYSEKLYQNMSDDMRSLFARDEEQMREAVAAFTQSQNQYAQDLNTLTAQFKGIMDSYEKAQTETLKNLSTSEQESARFWVACNQAMQNYLKEAAAAYERFEKANATSDKVLTALAATYQKNESMIENHQKQIREFQQTQTKLNETLEEIRRLFYQMEAAGSDGKQIYLYPGMSTQSKEAEQRMMRTVENMILESEGRQGETMEEIRHSMKEIADNTAKKSRWFGR